MVIGKLLAKSFGIAMLNWKTYSLETVKKGGPIPIQFFFSFVLANTRTKLTFVQLCRLKSPLSKDETRRDGSNPLAVILSLKHCSVCETMSQVLLPWTPLVEFVLYCVCIYHLNRCTACRFGVCPFISSEQRVYLLTERQRVLKPVRKLSLLVNFVPNESARPDQIADLIKEICDQGRPYSDWEYIAPWSEKHDNKLQISK